MTVEQRSLRSANRLLERLVGFLRAGQPWGAPESGYNIVSALTRHTVTDDEITDLVADFAKTRADAVRDVDVAVASCAVIGELPAPADVDRVVQRLLADKCGHAVTTAHLLRTRPAQFADIRPSHATASIHRKNQAP